MFVEASKFEEHFEAVGPGAFNNIEYANPLSMVLRTSVIKTADVSGSVRLYFDNKRNEVMTGRRFEPLGIWFLRAGSVYKMTTTLKLTGAIPPDTMIKVKLTEDSQDVMMLIDSEARVDSDGFVYFMVLPFRRIEMEKMTSVARLMFKGECQAKQTRKPRAKKAEVTPKIETTESGEDNNESNVPSRKPRSTKG